MTNPVKSDFELQKSYTWIKRTRRVQPQPYEFEELAIAIYVPKEDMVQAIRELRHELDNFETEVRQRAKQKAGGGNR